MTTEPAGVRGKIEADIAFYVQGASELDGAAKRQYESIAAGLNTALKHIDAEAAAHNAEIDGIINLIYAITRKTISEDSGDIAIQRLRAMKGETR